jgi:hypothetical protein
MYEGAQVFLPPLAMLFIERFTVHEVETPRREDPHMVPVHEVRFGQ